MRTFSPECGRKGEAEAWLQRFLRQAQTSQPTIIGSIVDPSRVPPCSNGLSRAVHHSKINRPTFGSGSSASILVRISALRPIANVGTASDHLRNGSDFP